MKNKVIIFVGPPCSGKSILLNEYINYWGGLEKIAYCLHYIPKVLEMMNDYKALVLECVPERDLFKMLDNVVNYGLENVKPIFIMMNDVPDLVRLKDYDFVQIFEFTPAKCVFPGGDNTRLLDIFSMVSKIVKDGE